MPPREDARGGFAVHLAEHHTGLLDDAAVGRADLRFLHFKPQVVPFAGPFSHPREDRETAVRTGNTGDELGQNNRLAQAGPAEQSGFTAADERSQQVDDLDSRFLNTCVLAESWLSSGACR